MGLYVLAGILGAVFGSFGNVLVMRFAAGKSISGRSKCPHCHKTIAWYDLVPIISFTLLRGHCRLCHKPIAWQYFMMEVVMSALFVLAFALSPSHVPLALATATVFFGLVLVSLFDLRYQQIPDMFTIIILFGALASTLLMGNGLSALMGVGVQFIWFGGQWAISRGRYVGTGDILLACSLGLWLGLWPAVAMLFIAYIVGASVALYLLGAGRVHFKTSRIAFGPFLATGAVMAHVGIDNMPMTLLVSVLMMVANAYIAAAY